MKRQIQMDTNVNRYTFSVILIILAALIAITFPVQSEGMGDSLYSSRDGGLEDSLNTGSHEKVYTLKRIQKLRKSVSPRYVRILDWREYGSYQSVMKKGILFTFEGYRNKNVFLVGNFNNWKPIPMQRNNMGVYFHILEPLEERDGEPLKSYRYKFLVDGIWMVDPANKTRLDDGMGGYLSSFYLENSDADHQVTARIIPGFTQQDEKTVEFRIYLPDVRTLTLVGSFNDWNPEHDLLVKGEDGIFRIKKQLRPGEYVYKYIADGKWILDKFNPDTRYHPEIHELTSYIVVP